MVSAISSGLQGMYQGENQVNEAAFQISSWGASAQTALNPPASQQPPASPIESNPVQYDSISLSSAAVNLVQGKDSFDANASTVHVADETAKQTINVIG